MCTDWLLCVIGTEFESASLEDIIRSTYGNSDKAALFNNATQVREKFIKNCLRDCNVIYCIPCLVLPMMTDDPLDLEPYLLLQRYDTRWK
jgi:hypothetical protein